MFSSLSHTSTRSARDITPNLCWCRLSSSITTPRREMTPRKYADRTGSLPAGPMWYCRGRRWSCLRLSASKPVITSPLSNAAWAKTPHGSSLTLWLIERVSDGRYHACVCVCVCVGGGVWRGCYCMWACHCVCHSVCVCVTLCVSVSLCVCLCHSVCVCVTLCVSVSLCVWCMCMWGGGECACV